MRERDLWDTVGGEKSGERGLIMLTRKRLDLC